MCNTTPASKFFIYSLLFLAALNNLFWGLARSVHERHHHAMDHAVPGVSEAGPLQTHSHITISTDHACKICACFDQLKPAGAGSRIHVPDPVFFFLSLLAPAASQEFSRSAKGYQIRAPPVI